MMRPEDLLVHVRMTRYEVCALPAHHDDFPAYRLFVEWRGDDQWVVRRDRRVLDENGRWEWESSLRDSDTANYHFDVETALRLAEDAARQVVTNGMTPADVLNADARA